MVLCPILETVIIVSYYRHSPGVHQFALKSGVPEDRDKIKLLGKLCFISSCASGLLFDS